MDVKDGERAKNRDNKPDTETRVDKCVECSYRRECLNNEWAGGCPIERGIYGPGSW